MLDRYFFIWINDLSRIFFSKSHASPENHGVLLYHEIPLTISFVFTSSYILTYSYWKMTDFISINFCKPLYILGLQSIYFNYITITIDKFQ